jgi:hypothetical protein
VEETAPAATATSFDEEGGFMIFASKNPMLASYVMAFSGAYLDELPLFQLATVAQTSPAAPTTATAGADDRPSACDQPNCVYRAKTSGHIDQHKAGVHGIGGTRHACDQPNCDFKAKWNAHLNVREANVYGIEVTWRACENVGCGYRTRSKNTLGKHTATCKYR